MPFFGFSYCFRAFKININLNTITQVVLFGFCSSNFYMAFRCGQKHIDDKNVLKNIKRESTIVKSIEVYKKGKSKFDKWYSSKRMSWQETRVEIWNSSRSEKDLSPKNMSWDLNSSRKKYESRFVIRVEKNIWVEICNSSRKKNKSRESKKTYESRRVLNHAISKSGRGERRTGNGEQGTGISKIGISKTGNL